MAMRTPAQTREFLRAVDHADALILAFPLYVDSLPYLATLALERIAAHRQSQTEPRPGSFLAIANCGFPEVAHNATAIAICRQFAEQAGYAWAGGLALGMGGAIAGRALSEVGGMAHNVVAALDLAADAIAQGIAVPDEASALMAKPFIPMTGYMLMGDIGWLAEARRKAVGVGLCPHAIGHRHQLRERQQHHGSGRVSLTTLNLPRNEGDQPEMRLTHRTQQP